MQSQLTLCSHEQKQPIIAGSNPLSGALVWNLLINHLHPLCLTIRVKIPHFRAHLNGRETLEQRPTETPPAEGDTAAQ